MIVFPHAKINLGLNVLRRRADGYHDIETVLVPIPLHDVLEVVVDDGLPENDVRFARTGITIPGNEQEDLCIKAVRALRRPGPLPGLDIHLHKVIPAGAGLGGGSSDAAHMLLLLNDLLQLHLDQEQLKKIAATLGSDVPFFLTRRAQLAKGRGEILEPVEVDLKGCWLVLVNPGIHISTAEAYQNCVPHESGNDLTRLLRAPRDQWQGTITNDLEAHALRVHPAVAAAKRKLLKAGAVFAAMSGSGSSVFGLFSDRPKAMRWKPDHMVRDLPL